MGPSLQQNTLDPLTRAKNRRITRRKNLGTSPIKAAATGVAQVGTTNTTATVTQNT